jgi:hypothetical protein
MLDTPVPAETVATCENCVMCQESSSRNARGFRFIPEVKCCSYVPVLPNFLVGGVLLDDDPAMEAGRRSMRTRIAARAAVTPLGLLRSPTQEMLYQHVTERGGFGRNAMVRCPHYVDSEAGNCSIWRHRNSVCSTWFCKHVRGARGAAFWKSLEGLLTIVEQQLVRWCLLRLDPDVETIASLLATERSDGKQDLPDETSAGDPAAERAYRRLWGRWVGREEELYRQCAELVAGLSWKDVVQICGAEAELAVRVVRSEHARLLDRSIPSRLRPAPYEMLENGRQGCRLKTYSALDPLELPQALLRILPAFDGRDTKEVVESVAEEEELLLTDELILKLVDFELLEEDDD